MLFLDPVRLPRRSASNMSVSFGIMPYATVTARIISRRYVIAVTAHVTFFLLSLLIFFQRQKLLTPTARPVSAIRRYDPHARDVCRQGIVLRHRTPGVQQRSMGKSCTLAVFSTTSIIILPRCCSSAFCCSLSLLHGL